MEFKVMRSTHMYRGLGTRGQAIQEFKMVLRGRNYLGWLPANLPILCSKIMPSDWSFVPGLGHLGKHFGNSGVMRSGLRHPGLVPSPVLKKLCNLSLCDQA